MNAQPKNFFTPISKGTPTVESKVNSFALEILISTNGFGVGGFYRKQYSTKVSGFIDLFISEASDESELVYTDYLGNTYYPGKVNRFLIAPLLVGVEYRLFEEEIRSNFRPFVSAGIGPSVIYSSPAQIEFFSSLKYGKSHFTGGGFLGMGIYWGASAESLIGVNVRYLYLPYPKGIESLESPIDGKRTKLKQMGGLYITLTFGRSY
ncbi:MAG: hypothetical protein KGZ58_00960 [Ignavibacteriales bacterium]|nr:hypothetical protein [Ignavibacteriales bacterium]